MPKLTKQQRTELETIVSAVRTADALLRDVAWLKVPEAAMVQQLRGKRNAEAALAEWLDANTEKAK